MDKYSWRWPKTWDTRLLTCFGYESVEQFERCLDEVDIDTWLARLARRVIIKLYKHGLVKEADTDGG